MLERPCRIADRGMAMPPEILALIDKPLSLIAVLFVGALAGILVEQFTTWQKRQAWRRRNGNTWKPKGGAAKVIPIAPKVNDSADQLRLVIRSDFAVQPLLN